MPRLLNQLFDTMHQKGTVDAQALLVGPLGLLVAYGLLRLSTSASTQLRELIFSRATEGASRVHRRPRSDLQSPRRFTARVPDGS